ncbi:unnamed protein product, partial [Mesorhabditis belari]|uniref:Uncharacterized protein n=1 Tax=Mesorhabditis belari TaxID=2138241 RepID=A0AAF3EGE6_9BILA
MFKVIKSYTKKANRTHEVAQDGGTYRSTSEVRNGQANGSFHNGNGGQIAQFENKHLAGALGGFSESSSYETREHFERKVQKVKKSRGERERSRSQRREVSEVLGAESGSSARDALLQWARKVTAGYPRVNVTNFGSSWRDGLAFNAILHRYRPNSIDWNKISDVSVSNKERLENAFRVAEREWGVTRLIDPEDVDTDHPDEKSLITYVSELYNKLPHLPEMSKLERLHNEYSVEAAEWLEWVERRTTLVDERHFTATNEELIYELERFRDDDLPPKFADKRRLEEIYEKLEVLTGTTLNSIPSRLSPGSLNRAWNQLLDSIDRRYSLLMERRSSQATANDLLSRLQRGIGITNEKLDLILHRIEDVEARVDRSPPAEIERQVNGIVDDLNALESPIQGFFEDVDELKTQGHPDATDFYRQVFGLHQRRTAYLDRLTNRLLTRLGVRTETLRRENSERLESIRKSTFSRVEECIQWVRERLEHLSNMEFVEDLEILEEKFEKHKVDNRDIQDFRQNVDECIARQAEVPAEDSHDYCELLRILESEYQQLRDLSAGRMLDLDSLIAFVRAAQLELVWVSEREEIEVTRNWSDIKQLDTHMLQNYYKQLLHEIELREKPFNDVHNQGAALLNQGHPAVHVIEVYLRTMQSQWDWLLSLSKCLEEHLRDALNLKSFMEEAADAEAWMEEQSGHLERNYNRTDFSLEEGERFLRELDEIKEILNKYHGVLLALTERANTISPLWQRGERITRPIVVTALCDYSSKEVNIRAGDDVALLENSDLIHWKIRDISGHEGQVPSVVFRIPPPDPRLTEILNRLLQKYEKLRKLWERKHRMVRFYIVLNTMKQIQEWDLDTFNSIDPEKRDAIIRALNDDANKLLAELDPNDPLYKRLKDELKKTMDHFWNLLNQSQKPPEPDYASQYDQKVAELLRKLDEAWRKLNERVGKPVSRTPEELEKEILEHKQFEDALQALDADVANVKELFRQLPNPSPNQRMNNEKLAAVWENLWDLSRMYVERIKVLEAVLNGMLEVDDIVRAHEITLSSFDDMPADIAKLRGVHSQLLEMNMVLQQQQTIIDALNRNLALLRQHVARTRMDAHSHPDVDRIEEEVQQLNVRWENVGAQVAERLKAVERALQIQMVYRSEWENEMTWLDRVEATINQLRKPEDLRPEEYQKQLDILVAEYAQLQEHTDAIENVNREGGKFIRDAKNFDLRLNGYQDGVTRHHGQGIRREFRRSDPQPKNGAEQVKEELEQLNRRFAQLSSLILERRNHMQVLIQNWKRQKQEEEDRRRAEEEERRRAFEAARLKALEDADRLRREREAAEGARRAADEEARRRREEEERRRREEEERRRKEADDAARRRREEEDERRRREEEERRRREREDEERMRREDEERRRREEEWKNKTPNYPWQVVEPTEDVGHLETTDPMHERAKIEIEPDEMQMYQEETITSTQFYEMEGVLHKQTGEILTFVEAIRQGLLDLHSGGGQFFDLISGSRISLEKAAELGYIEGGFQDTLNKHWGIHHPDTGATLTLLQAIQIGLYDPDMRQLRDIHTGEVLDAVDCEVKKIISSLDQHKLIKMGILKTPPMSLPIAIEKNVLNTHTGECIFRYTKEQMPLKDAIYHGYVRIGGTQSGQPAMIAPTLSDVIENDLINANNGEFVDKNGDDKFTLREATNKQNALLNTHVNEIVNTADKTRLTLGQALVRNAIDLRAGNFKDLQHKQNLSLREAHREDLICRPRTLTEMHEKNLIDSTGQFIDAGTKSRYTLLEAIVAGVLDPEVRHIVDPAENDVVSIAAALERGLLNAQGRIVLEKEQREFMISEAVREGLLAKRVRHSIFDIKGFRNTQTGQSLSFKDAVDVGVLIPNAERVVDLSTRDSFMLSDEKAKDIVDSALLDLLTKPVGIRDGGSNLSVIRGVSRGLIDPSKALFFNKNTKQEYSVAQAYQHGLVTLRGALQLLGMFDIHPTLVAPVKRVDKKKRISRPGQPQFELAADQVKVTLEEAMKQGLINSGTQRFRQGDIDISLQDALTQGLIDPASEWIVPAKQHGAGPTIEEKTTESVTETGQHLAPKVYPDKNVEESVTTVKRVRTTETTALGGPGGVSVYRAITGAKGTLEVPASGYHLYEAERKGIVDLTTGQITPPGVEQKLSFKEGIELGIIDERSILVRDRSGRMVNVKEALENGTMDKNGNVNGRNLEKLIDEKSIVIEAEALVPLNEGNKIIQFSSQSGPVMAFRPVGHPVVEETEQAWSFDSQKGELVDHISGQRLTLEAAVASGKLSADDLKVRDALTGREMSFEEAEKWGIIDSRSGYYMDKNTGHRLTFTEAAQQHRIYPTGGVPDNAADALHTTVKVHTRTAVAKKEALSGGQSAIQGGSSFNQAIGWYDVNTGTFTHPETQKQLTLKEAIVKGLFNPYDITVSDRRRNKEINLLEAMDEGIVDDTAGTVTDTASGRKINLRDALNQGILKGKSVADIVERDFTGRAEAHGSREPPPIAHHQSHHHSITPASFPQPTRPTSGGQRIVEQSLHYTDFSPSGGSQFVFNFPNFPVALREHKQKPAGGEGRTEMMDLGGGNQVMVKVVRDEHGIEKGQYVDPNTGMKFTIQMHGDPFVTETKTTVKSTSQVQSIELEPHAEFVGIDRIRDKRNNRVMSLEDAKRIGLARVDKKGKQHTKTYAAFRSNLQNAVTKGVIDANGSKISLEDAIRARIIDINALTYANPKTGESLPLGQAANMGLVDVTLSETLPKGVIHPTNNERIPIQRAIQLGIVDSRTGEVHNPFTKERLTWLDLLKSVYNAVTNQGVYDPTKGYGVPVTSALNEGLLDSKTGRYHNTITKESMELDQALEKGLIDRGTYDAITAPSIRDFHTNRDVSLMDAVRSGIIDPKNRTIQLSRQSIVPISKAVQDGRIPREIGSHLRRVDKLTFAEALGKGLIDVSSNSFKDPDTGRQIPLQQAIDEGFMDEGSLRPLEAEQENNLANVLESNDFDDASGRLRDKKSGLHLTFKAAVDRDLIDGDSLLHETETAQTLTLREAVSRGKIDQDGKYVDSKSGNRLRLKEAVQTGHLALISSPMDAARVVAEAVKRRDAEGYRFRLEGLDEAKQHHRHSGGAPKFREETTVYRLNRPEPGLAVRMRMSDSTGAVADRARSIIEDPSSLAEMQHEFLNALEAAQFDTEARILENPATNNRVSVREAAETGLLDVLSGEIVHPDTGRRYTLPKAVHMKLLQVDPAKRLMQALGQSTDELEPKQTSSSFTPGGHTSTTTTSYGQPGSGFGGYTERTTTTTNTIPGAGGEGETTNKTWTKTVDWKGRPEELRHSDYDPLERYTTYTKDNEERVDAPQWARRH